MLPRLLCKGRTRWDFPSHPRWLRGLLGQCDTTQLEWDGVCSEDWQPVVRSWAGFALGIWSRSSLSLDKGKLFQDTGVSVLPSCMTCCPAYCLRSVTESCAGCKLRCWSGQRGFPRAQNGERGFPGPSSVNPLALLQTGRAEERGAHTDPGLHTAKGGAVKEITHCRKRGEKGEL